jgi:hypothetical protein
VFVLGRAKTPLPNCRECGEAGAEHNREVCECLTCHGFYAATLDVNRVERMLMVGAGGLLAVRTGIKPGREAGLLVIDAESAEIEVHGKTVDEHGEERKISEFVTGVQVTDEWQAWTGVTLPATLRQRTKSGGVHYLYEVDAATPPNGLRSRGRILPQVDVKANGGYVAVPTPGSGRSWDWSLSRLVTPLSDELLTWLVSAPGGRSTSTNPRSDLDGNPRVVRHFDQLEVDGYDFKRARDTRAQDGERDVFFRDLVYSLRRAGVSRERAEKVCLYHWQRCAQPPTAKWYMPWDHVLYKLEHTWHNVEPEVIDASDWRVRYARRARDAMRSAVRGDDVRDAGVLTRPGIQPRGTVASR